MLRGRRDKRQRKTTQQTEGKSEEVVWRTTLYHFRAGVVVTAAAAAALLAPLPPRRPLRRSPRGQPQLLLLVEVGLSDARQAFLPRLFVQKRLPTGICFPQGMTGSVNHGENIAKISP